MKLPDFIIKEANYEGCVASFKAAKVVLVGAGYDGTSSYRKGSRYAPAALRKETYYAQEDYSPYFRQDVKDKAIHDLGDIVLEGENKEGVLQRIEATSRFLVENQKIPFFLGGEHLITLPAIKPLIVRYPDLHVIQFDAHLDLIDKLFGDSLSHGTVMRRIHDLLGGPGRIFQVGIRSGSPEEYQFARENTRLFEFNTSTFLEHIHDLKDKPVYLTVDLDVFDPSLIPGTGTPEAGGIFFPEFISALKAMQSLNIVGADMVELAPQIDPTGVSTIVASKILREILMIL
ncbi:MAG: agmatinase [Calditrichia bacterium]